MSERGREPSQQRPLAHMDTRAAAVGGCRHVPASCPALGVAETPLPPNLLLRCHKSPRDAESGH